MESVHDTLQIFSWISLPEPLKSALPQGYTYLIKNFNELPSYRTSENFSIPQFELDAFVDINDKEKAQEWFKVFESHTKTTMPQSKGYGVKGNQVLFREKRHCIHSNKVKEKQGNRETKLPQSSRARNTGCTAEIHLRLERWRLETNYPFEINIRFTHNHVINSAESLSFRRVNSEVREKILELFKDGHSPASAKYSYEDGLHLSAENDQELVELLADRSNNPDYGYVVRLFQEYRENTLGSPNGKKMFERLGEVVENYNISGNGKAVLQEFNAEVGKSFILCIVTGLMCRIHETVPQAGEICYMDASASFEPLNTSITLLYTSCAAGALPLGLFITSDELEITLEKALNLLKTILPPCAFYGRGAQVGPAVFLTDDSSAERNALELCWPQGIRLLCTFHILQAFWRWIHDSKHQINKEDRVSIMGKMKKILYARSDSEMNLNYGEFKQAFYNQYPLLRNHFELLWERRRFWALSYRSILPIRGNNTNNYVERSFGILKDIIFSRTQAYNSVQVFQFVTENMERFYKRRLLGIAHQRPGHTIAKRFFCPGWESVNGNAIQQTAIESEYLVPSTKDPSLFYVVNSAIGSCSCPVGMTGTPCKHQGAVSMKFHVASLNFIPSLTPNDRMVFTYVALGHVSQDSSFYASLRAGPSSQGQILRAKSPNERLENCSVAEWKELNKENEDINDPTILIPFLEAVKEDYQSCGPQFRTALNKFIERYFAAKSISIPRLSSFLYGKVDAARVKSGAMIRVQVESVKRRKLEGSNGTKRKLPASGGGGKENSDPQAIPSRKKRKTGKKEHNLSKNISRNRLN
ncbi:hypothetical protein RhiirA4_426357 [Rhizophagus irregularis]|uniref:SWIM-type domain-containing protein n=1 Tax=Rhizophagus irregularis TaxID=588596 RepID=A0A2I1H4S7_9GLOM|nr:hypothetical protein RhiirA4_426357 [Rhizophagus irregularis]